MKPKRSVTRTNLLVWMIKLMLMKSAKLILVKSLIQTEQCLALVAGVKMTNCLLAGAHMLFVSLFVTLLSLELDQ